MRRRLVRMDRLILGASPDKLARQREIGTAAVAAPLSLKERSRLDELTRLMATERLTPAEEYERRQLAARRTQ